MDRQTDAHREAYTRLRNAIEGVYNKKIFMVAYQITASSDQFCFQFQAESPDLYDILENRRW